MEIKINQGEEPSSSAPLERLTDHLKSTLPGRKKPVSSSGETWRHIEITPEIKLQVKDIFTDEDMARFEEVVAVNLIGAFLCAQRCARVMLENGGGSIVNVASILGMVGSGQVPQASYAATKGGLVNLTRELAAQWARKGIRVNAVCPGLIETGMTKPIFDFARSRGNEKKIGQLNPLQRHGIPEEIAQAAVFLASDESSYVNGQATVVDGGLTTSLPFVPLRG